MSTTIVTAVSETEQEDSRTLSYTEPMTPQHSLAAILRSDSSKELSPTYQPSINDQHASPLFSKLPAELRNRILYLALLEHDNLAEPVPFNSYAYRPSRQFAKTISGISLLLTCKLIYLEAYLIPIMTTTHCDFQCWEERAPLERALYSRTAFEKMTVEQRAAVQTIHITAQQCYLESLGWANHSLPAIKETGEVRPKKVIITVRYHDWWNWEDGQPLDLGEGYGEDWRGEFRDFGNALEKVVMELEMKEERKAELEDVVKDVVEWRIELDEGKVLVANESAVKREIWEGSQDFDETTDPDVPKQKYYVATVMWTCSSEA